MIRYALQCDHDHEFDAWFRSSGDHDEQVREKTIACPMCGSREVRKAIMAPSVVTSGKRVRTGGGYEKFARMVAELRKHVEANADYVGDRFAEEARRIHYGETDERGIYGEATLEEARELIEEGVEVAPLPQLSSPGKVN
ncbi:MAG: DUF1178 family protein [Parvibaculaceae bacterium]|nr:DUF1178 family protein [Parvibaculaceae bacterium]